MYHKDPRSFYPLLAERAAGAPEDIALFSDSRALSWRETAHTVRSLCHVLATRHGVGAETQTVYRCRNRIGDITLLFALLSLGCQVSIEAAPGGEPFPRLRLSPGGEIDTEALLTQVVTENIPCPEAYDTKNANIVLFTSGTEMLPKGIVLSQYAFWNNARNLADAMGLLPCDRICLIPSVHHCFGLITLLAGIAAGAAVYFPETGKYPALLEKLSRNRITVVNAVPTVFLGMLEDAGSPKALPGTLRTGIIAGGMYTPSQFREIETRFSMTLLSTYGLTECCATVTFCDPHGDNACHVGRFLPGVEGCIQSPAGQLLPPEREGEICVRGYNLMTGYLSGDRFTPCPLDENGWFHTGDLGSLDGEENLHITGRLKQIIIRGGENISAQKLALTALELPFVQECAVVGIPHSFYGEVPCMAVKAAPGFDLPGFRSALAQALPRHEYPAKILVLAEIPVNANGKYDLQALRSLFQNTHKKEGSHDASV